MISNYAICALSDKFLWNVVELQTLEYEDVIQLIHKRLRSVLHIT